MTTARRLRTPSKLRLNSEQLGNLAGVIRSRWEVAYALQRSGQAKRCIEDEPENREPCPFSRIQVDRSSKRNGRRCMECSGTTNPPRLYLSRLLLFHMTTTIHHWNCERWLCGPLWTVLRTNQEGMVNRSRRPQSLLG